MEGAGEWNDSSLAEKRVGSGSACVAMVRWVWQLQSRDHGWKRSVLLPVAQMPTNLTISNEMSQTASVAMWHNSIV